MKFKVGDKVILKREACLAVGADPDNCPVCIVFYVHGGNFNYVDCSPSGDHIPFSYHVPANMLLRAPS